MTAGFKQGAEASCGTNYSALLFAGEVIWQGKLRPKRILRSRCSAAAIQFWEMNETD